MAVAGNSKKKKGNSTKARGTSKKVSSSGKKLAKTSLKAASSTIKKTGSYEKEIYDLKQMLEISRSLSTTLEYSKLIESIIYIAMAQMRITGAGIIIHEGIDSDVFTLGSYFFGMTKDSSYDYKISINSALISFFRMQIISAVHILRKN